MAKPTSAPAKANEDPEVPAGVMARRFYGGDKLEYPAVAKSQHLSGWVLLSVDIDAKGHVVGEREIAGPKMLLDAVAQAVKTWKYRPYKVDGKPVKVNTLVPVYFIGQ